MLDTIDIGDSTTQLILNDRKPLFINEDRFKQTYGRGFDKDMVKIHEDKKKVSRNKR